LNFQQNHFNKDFRAKTPNTQRENNAIFSELGVLCAFAGVAIYLIPKTQFEGKKH